MHTVTLVPCVSPPLQFGVLRVSKVETGITVYVYSMVTRDVHAIVHLSLSFMLNSIYFPMESRSSFERSMYTEFFEFRTITKDEKNIDVKCKLCPPTKKTYRTSVKSTSNLKKHLEVRSKKLVIIRAVCVFRIMWVCKIMWRMQVLT